SLWLILSPGIAKDLAGRGAELLAKRRDEGRQRFVAAAQRHIGDPLATLQRRQCTEQPQALPPGAEGQAGFAQEQPAQGAFRDAQRLAPVGQALAGVGVVLQAYAQLAQARFGWQ